jgi:hypothetical protein
MSTELVLRRHRWAGVLHSWELIYMLYGCAVKGQDHPDLTGTEISAHYFARAAGGERIWPDDNWVYSVRWVRDHHPPGCVHVRRLADLLDVMGIEVPETVPRY